MALLLLCGCTQQRGTLKVTMSDTGFSRHGDLLLYHHQLFSGVSFSLYPSGDTARRVEYVNGKQDGWLRWWYPNKQLDQCRLFVDGKKQGIHRGWWPNGQTKFEYHFTDDEHNGELKEWGANGKMFRFFHYKMGHEEGSEKMWWEDGRVRANYVIINGEKFGLFGQKLCVNVLKKDQDEKR
ncbi:toxin-antitoxin system YwqK family antitoxin [Mucilaginibacter sp. AW1-3]